MELDDFDQPISELIKWTKRPLATASRASRNPFKLPPSCESLGFREQNRRAQEAERERLRTMSLLQRTEALKPPIPSLSTTKSRSNSTLSRYMDNNSSISKQSYVSKQMDKPKRISEFIQQTREVYHMQLLMDRKGNEMQKINSKIRDAESNLIKREQDIADELQTVKLETTKFEQKLSRFQKKAETATRKRVDLTKKLKQVKISLDMINSDISKNEELLEQYQLYHEFLVSLKPASETDLFEFYNHPDILVNMLNKIQDSNLFIIRKCQYYDSRFTNNVSLYENQLSDAKNDFDDLNAKICQFDSQTDNLIHSIIQYEEFNESSKIQSEKGHEEYQRLAKLVQKTYENCLKKESNINPISMLEEIEMHLNVFLKDIELIEPSFVKQKQQQRDKERREKLRRDKQENWEIEQAKKMKQAIERSNKPIKKKTGRPILARSQLMKIEKKGNQELIRQRLEQQRIEELLYGKMFE